MDDGTATGTYSEVNLSNDPAVRNLPGLSSFTITTFAADGSDAGTNYIIYLTVFTAEGSTNSD